MKNNIEKRSFEFAETKLELREEDGVKKIRGYASVFNSPSNNPLWNGMHEIIGRNAFVKTLGETNDIKALYNHNTDKVMQTCMPKEKKLPDLPKQDY